MKATAIKAAKEAGADALSMINTILGMAIYIKTRKTNKNLCSLMIRLISVI